MFVQILLIMLSEIKNFDINKEMLRMLFKVLTTTLLKNKITSYICIVITRIYIVIVALLRN